jgi:predicted N-acetyltransferase YhbS
MQVTPMDPDEVRQVAEITVSAYEHDAANWPSGMLSDEYRKELSAVAERSEHTRVLVARNEAEIVGSVAYIDSAANPYAEFDDPQAAGIRMLAVAPAHQRSGAGKAMVQACLHLARSENKKRVILHTASWMRSAQRFYERLGFDRAPELDWTPIPNVPLLGYSYTLDQVAHE